MPRAPHDEVASMLDHLETTYEWETGWNDRAEDHYCDGEMLSYRRIKHPSGTGTVDFIFTEDGMHSSCYIMADDGNHTVVTREQFDEALTALSKGCLAALVKGGTF